MMDKLGLKFSRALEYELFEPLQYWLDYDVEYDEFVESIEKSKVIELELEEDEDRVEDIEMLQNFLEKLAQQEISYELLVMNDKWESKERHNIL